MSGLGKSGIPYCTHSWSPSRGCVGCQDVGSACWALRTCWRAAHNPNRKVAAQFEGLVSDTCQRCGGTMADGPGPPSGPKVCPTGDCGYWSDEGVPGGPLVWTGLIRTYPEVFDAPLRRRKPSVIFVCPQGDLSHANAETVRRVFGIALAADDHQFLFATKWPRLLLEKLKTGRTKTGIASVAAEQLALTGALDGDPEFAPYLDHLWVGVTATDQRTYDERVSAICDPETGWPGNKWVSLEPCMGPIDLHGPAGDCQPSTASVLLGRALQWVIAGSANTLSNGAAAFTPAIARSLREQAEAAGVPFWLKQARWDGPQHSLLAPETTMYSGPRLDGRVHREAPESIAAILREAGKL